MSLEQEVLGLLRRSDGALSENEILAALKLPKHLKKRIQASLVELETKGLIRQNSRHRYGLGRAPEKSGQELLAFFSLKGSGNGIAKSVEGGTEFFIPERRRGWALSGDTVLLKKLPARPTDRRRGRREAPEELQAAEVLEVRKRGRQEWVGELRREASATYLTLRQGELELDLDLIEVPANIPQGDWVVASAPGLDSGGKNPSPARFLSHLGGENTPQLDTLILIRKAELKEDFSPETVEEAESLPKEPRESDFQGRLDLRQQIVFTIDGADAKDFDDAVSIERNREGYRLGVHIADVSHYVRPGTALDREAYERGTSVYLPDRVLPMLPEALSNGLCSLKPDLPRLTQSAFMEFDRQGRMLSWTTARSLIQSARRFTYDEVEDYFEGRGGLRADEKPKLGPVLDLMRELALKRRERREERGALDFNFPETKVDMDAMGRPTRLWRRTRLFAHQLIEEFMLAANEAVARELKAKAVPFLYRIHEAPDEEKLAETMALLGRMKLGAPRGQHVSPLDIQKILKRAEGKKEERLVHSVLLRSLRLARYAPEQDIHFGLALEDYCHFTSPIRRYPDLLVHRGLAALLEGRSASSAKGELGDLTEKGLHCSSMERKAEACERDCIKAKQIRYLEGKIGEVFEARINSVTNFGFFAEIIEFPAEGLVPIGLMDDDYYVFNSEWLRLEGRRRGRTFSIGDLLKIGVKRADWRTLQVDFVLA